MFHHPAWAVGSYSRGPPAGGTPQIQVKPTQVYEEMGRPALLMEKACVCVSVLCVRGAHFIVELKQAWKAVSPRSYCWN